MSLYEPLSISADCSFVAIQAALEQLAPESKVVSSDVYVSNRWSEEDRLALRKLLWDENCLANRVRIDPHLKPFEWYVECCGKCVGCNPAG